jgi:MFS family permease
VKIFRTLEPQQQKNLFALFIAGLLFWTSLACLLPTLPLYLEDLGSTTQQIGWLMGSFAVGLLLFRPRMGKLADRRSRKLVVLIGVGVVILAPLGYLFATSLPLLFLLRVFHGISVAAYTTGSSALIVDSSPVDKRGEVIGYMTLAYPIGAAIGPAIGGFLHAKAGYTPLFLFSSLMGVLSFCCASQVREAGRVPVETDTKSSPSQGDRASAKPDNEKFWRLLGSPRLRIPTLIMLMTGLIFGSLATFIALYIREAKVDLNPGWFYTAAAIASFGTRLVAGPASDRYGRGLFITVSLVFYNLAMLLLSQAHTPVSFLVAGILEGAGGGTLIPMIIALISDRSHSFERGRVLALCIGGFDLGIAIAGPVFGMFAQQLGYHGIFAIALGISLLALIVFITQNGKNFHHSLRFATGRERDMYAL